MLKLDLQRVMEDKGIDNPNKFLIKNGITAHTASRLLNNKIDTIRFKHLEAICLALHCSIDDLFAWSFEDKTNLYKDHPLQKLKRGKRKGNITHKLKDLTPEKLTEVRNFIEGLTKS